jgi:hypothetical protein
LLFRCLFFFSLFFAASTVGRPERRRDDDDDFDDAIPAHLPRPRKIDDVFPSSTPRRETPDDIIDDEKDPPEGATTDDGDAISRLDGRTVTRKARQMCDLFLPYFYSTFKEKKIRRRSF